jgi:HlyD family secretion protein
MQIASPIQAPARRWLPFAGLRLRPLLLLLLGLAVLGGVAYFAYQRFMTPAVVAPIGAVVPVQRGTVASTVSATGSVIATKQARLVFPVVGRLKEILVSVGDKVTAGQPLARLQTDASEVKLDQAKSALTVANLRLAQLTEGATPEDIAAAQASYDAAAAKLAELQSGPTRADMDAARAALASAQSNFDQATAKVQTLMDGPTTADRIGAETAVIAAQNSITSAQAKLEQLLAGPTAEDVAAARGGVEQANASLRSAQAKLDQLSAGATAVDVAAAQASVEQAQGSVNNARAKLDQVKATTLAVPPEVLSAQSTVAAAEGRLHAAHEALDQLSVQLTQATASLAAQQSSLASTKRSADQTCDKLGDSSAECATAKSRVDSAQVELLKLESQIKLISGNGAWDQVAAHKDVVAAQAAYDAAAANLKQVSAAQRVPVDLISAQTAYDSAVAGLTSARAKLEQVQAGATSADMISAQSAVEQARIGVLTAQAKLDTLLAGPNQADVVAAQTSVDTANANLSSAQAKLEALGLTLPQDLQAARSAAASAQLGVQSARAKLAQLQAGPTQAELESARSAIANAQASLATKANGTAKASDIALQQESVRQAELAVQQAQIDLENNTLLAPFDGVVATITGNVGEQAPTGTTGFMTLIDPSQVRVDVTVDEADVAKIAVGKTAQISFDALPGRPFPGRVVSIAPAGTVTQGVVSYPVALSIQTRDIILPAGMTASTIITIDQKENVLVVPNRAIRRQGREQVVEVLGADGKTASRPVRTGLQGEQTVEVIEGLSDGDRVVLPATTTRQPNVGGPGGAAVPAGPVVQFRAKP